jgi:hypothetical protein
VNNHEANRDTYAIASAVTISLRLHCLADAWRSVEQGRGRHGSQQEWRCDLHNSMGLSTPPSFDNQARLS